MTLEGKHIIVTGGLGFIGARQANLSNSWRYIKPVIYLASNIIFMAAFVYFVCKDVSPRHMRSEMLNLAVGPFPSQQARKEHPLGHGRTIITLHRNVFKIYCFAAFLRGAELSAVLESTGTIVPLPYDRFRFFRVARKFDLQTISISYTTVYTFARRCYCKVALRPFM
jgi:hypothetical protein